MDDELVNRSHLVGILFSVDSFLDSEDGFKSDDVGFLFPSVSASWRSGLIGGDTKPLGRKSPQPPIKKPSLAAGFLKFFLVS